MRVSGPRDERIAAVAAVQRGHVSRRQLLAVGISYDTMARLVRRGALWPLHGGSVFTVGPLQGVDLGAETAALLAMPAGTMLSSLTAGELWDMGVRSDGRVHVTVNGGGSHHLPGIVVHRSRVLTTPDVRVHRGLPVTSPARTLLDLASVLTERQLERGFDRALVSRNLALGDVAELLSRVAGYRGAPALKALLDRHSGTTVTRSEAEEMFLSLVRDANLPHPEVNIRIAGYEVDFLWRAQKLVVEIDGFRFHSTARRFEHDHRKDAVLRAAGLEVRRFTFWQVQDEPLFVVAGVAQGL